MPLSHCHDCLLCGTLQYAINSITVWNSLRNGTPSNLKLHHISKNPSKKLFWQEDEALLANEALCLSTMVNLVL